MQKLVAARKGGGWYAVGMGELAALRAIFLFSLNAHHDTHGLTLTVPK